MVGGLPLGWGYLPVALALGALHALEPGHGKSLASAYLVAGKHTWKDALVLGAATTVSHTAVVVLLALASLGLRSRMDPGRLEQNIGLFGAWTLIGLGAWVSARSIRDLRHGHSHGHTHGHSRGLGHAHDGGHDSEDGSQGFWGVAIIGLGNGLLPCPGALAALLVALSLGQAALGLATVLTYSLGLALALATMGIVVVEAGRRARTWLPSDRGLLWLPLASGLLVSGTGVALLLLR
jgi:ABC-type nickel/cobalt efflux system permease component RcnA